ncbi:hypothetical protein E4U42_006397 [Claviceps africana]|uniref:Peptidase S33 tripeptidyl aminopeptidase-like C-terminal domain-containing protein n=1 Tax=Claviceps africana TaxID=83212 RepID=A0A8K0NGT9_9HYPO|nr:hypothetical protein E4U42_006397 [Claviceps africana]
MRPLRLLSLLPAFPVLGHADTIRHQEQATSFNWTSIEPSKTLEYHGCYANTHQCARLILPLDYTNPNDTRNVIIAILKKPAAVPDDHPTFGGSIFVNPGGPGASAADAVRNMGEGFFELVERSGRRHYEWIGIDPRGIGYSWPAANCFPHDLFSRDMSQMEARGLGPLNQGDRTVPYGLALMRGFAQHCLAADSAANGGSIMAYAGTASVARDMVEIADQIEKLRQKAARRSSTAHNHRTGHDVARVQYIGFSYGTVLGHYLVSLFPERVGRIVLDGVVDAQDYSTGAGWTKNLMDTDKIYTAFFEGCHQNPSDCALSRPQDSSSKDIQDRVERWLHTIEDSPITSTGTTGDIRVLTASDVRAVMGFLFYSPYRHFRGIAMKLDWAMNGKTGPLFEQSLYGLTPRHSPDGCARPPDPESDAGDGKFPVLCGDGDDVSGKDAAWWRRYAKRLASQSSILGESWSSIRFQCSSWPFKPSWRFTGPFTAPVPRKSADGKPVPGYPAAPNLYLSSRLDPVTPLANARLMQSKYPASGLVVVEGAGHGATGVAEYNKCLFDVVEDYLETGNVPSQTTYCPDECGPWKKNCTEELHLAKRRDAHPLQRRRPRFPLAIMWD